jgi:tetratricopeptide (TPR) repeat protein
MAADRYEELSHKGRQALSEGNAGLARQYYLHALAERPAAPDAHYGLATACFLLNDLETSAFHFKEVTRLDPLRAGAFVNLGAVYNRLGQFDDAVKALRRGIQLDNHCVEAYYNLGLVYRRQGQSELAIQAYREATHLNPKMVDAHYNLANLLLDMGRYSQAIVHYRHALELRPDFEKAKLGLEQATAALQQSESPTTVGKAGSSPRLATGLRGSDADLHRVLDPLVDGPVLTALHKATIVSENYGKDFLKILEHEVEPAIKELSSCLLYPEKTSDELAERLAKFEAAIASLTGMQRNLQHSMKKLREISDRLVASHTEGTPVTS